MANQRKSESYEAIYSQLQHAVSDSGASMEPHDVSRFFGYTGRSISADLVLYGASRLAPALQNAGMKPDIVITRRVLQKTGQIRHPLSFQDQALCEGWLLAATDRTLRRGAGPSPSRRELSVLTTNGNILEQQTYLVPSSNPRFAPWLTSGDGPFWLDDQSGVATGVTSLQSPKPLLFLELAKKRSRDDHDSDRHDHNVRDTNKNEVRQQMLARIAMLANQCGIEIASLSPNSPLNPVNQ